MSTKTLLITSVLFGFLLSAAAGLCFADASEQFKQANDYKRARQYEKAEAIYQQIVTSFPGSDDALEAQKQLTLLYITTDSPQQADAAFDGLTTGFAEHDDIAKAIYQIAQDGYHRAKKYDKAVEIHQYNVEHFTSDMYAMWSQVGIANSYISRGKDNATVDAAIDKLLGIFSEQPTLPTEIWKMANRCDRNGRPERALELHRYNVDYYPEDKYALWSQVQIIKSCISDADETAAADAATNKLISVFSAQPTLPTEIWKIANRFDGLERIEKAIELHKYNVDNFPNDENAMLSQIYIVYSCIGNVKDGNDTAVDAAIDKLTSVFSARPDLPRELYKIAGKFKGLKMLDKAYQYYQYVAENFSDNDHALMAQQQMVSLNLKLGDQAGASADVEKLIADFKEDENIAEAVSQVAKTYRANKKFTEAIELYNYVLENHPDDVFAIWAQVRITEINIELGVDEAIDAAVGKLRTEFSEHPLIGEALYTVAEYFSRAKKHDKSTELHQYNIAQHPEDMYAMRSQAKIIASHIRNINESDADAAIEKLISVFSSQSTLPQEVYQVANIYKDAGQSSSAIRLYQRVSQTWPDDDSAILSQKGIAMINISLEHHAAVDAVIGAMIVDFNDRPLLPKALLEIGEQYYNIALRNKNKGLAVESQENFQKARAVWERIITELPPSPISPDVYFLSAENYVSLDQKKKAAVYYQKVVDNWPDYKYSWHSQYLVARIYKNLKRSGAMLESEANTKIKAAYERILQDYPESSAVHDARKWFNRNENLSQGEQK
jgi:tetratricopeptide (TPR) repeat protein